MQGERRPVHGGAALRPRAMRSTTMAIPGGCVVGGMIVSIIASVVAGLAGSAVIGMLGGLIALVGCLAGAVLGVVAIDEDGR